MEITSSFIPSHILIPLIISLALLVLTLLTKKIIFNQRKWLWISIIVFFCVYIFILVYTSYLSNYYKVQLQTFDLDGNGSFSADERTPEQQRIMRKTVKDTARNFAFITGLIYAFIIACLTFILGKVFEMLKKNVFVKRK